MWLTLSRARRRPLTEPSLVQFLSPSSPFSSSSSPLSPDPPAKDDASADRQPSQPPPTSFLKDVRESLKKPDLTRWPTQSRPNSISSRNRAADPYLAQTPTLQEIRKNLSEYRRRSSAPSPDAKSAAQGQQQRHHMSFQQLYERNVSAEGDVDGGVRSGFSGGNPTVPGFAAFERIKESLKNSSSRADSYNIRAGSKQSRSKVERQVIPNDTGRMGNDYNKEYAYKELGEELKKLRPEQKQGQKGWFSLQELSERLSKFRELVKDKGHCAPAQELKSCLKVLEYMKDTKDKVVQGHSTSILSKIGGTPDYLSMTPKEHLVEKYIHPDNMSSQEKMKLELAKVRDEFKMSESDCGSSRVQVALLTTKIKHLSSVLHKKDKHSRKGLQEMVQKRKKLLKYLRRTDWDSYCIVLSKLGLRDNPDYKNL